MALPETVSAMAPKAKVKAKAKAKGLAKAKAGPVRRLGAMRVRLVAALRRPAAAPLGDGALGLRELWRGGHAIKAEEVPVSELVKGVDLVIEEGSYFGAPVRLACTAQGLDLERDATHVLVRATGTDSEALLRHCTGHPKDHVRVHLCPGDCAADRVAEDLVHGRRLRLGKGPEAEDPWTRNLVETERHDGDELAGLREKKKEYDEAEGGARPAVKEPRKRSRDRKKEDKRGRSSKRKKRSKKSREPLRSRSAAPAPALSCGWMAGGPVGPLSSRFRCSLLGQAWT